MPAFHELAALPDPPLDELALALAAEFRDVDDAAARATLDALAQDLAAALARTDGSPQEEARVAGDVLGTAHGFAGDERQYDDPRNSMLDVVLERRRGLPILLSVVYVAVGRRTGVALEGVGLPGHYVVGHFGCDPPLLLDPFGGGSLVETHDAAAVRPWSAHDTAMRMLNNLVGSFRRRAHLAHAIKAAQLRLVLPSDPDGREVLERELRALQARLN
ncbi:transglutaminase-like domain-containing protein [Conexibacter sp. SYSU D00693]|uniref:transglutaminase-like domain-containing protein n=1 Tax=Conexibacter sp. SYSU D00693 TaxID=2812560 RepID=UPI00196A765E|nr:transglutaminase-like domain-containing protein [Conexibacter sp. SYSU D00693]